MEACADYEDAVLWVHAIPHQDPSVITTPIENRRIIGADSGCLAIEGAQGAAEPYTKPRYNVFYA